MSFSYSFINSHLWLDAISDPKTRYLVKMIGPPNRWLLFCEEIHISWVERGTGHLSIFISIEGIIWEKPSRHGSFRTNASQTWAHAEWCNMSKSPRIFWGDSELFKKRFTGVACERRTHLQAFVGEAQAPRFFQCLEVAGIIAPFSCIAGIALADCCDLSSIGEVVDVFVNGPKNGDFFGKSPAKQSTDQLVKRDETRQKACPSELSVPGTTSKMKMRSWLESLGEFYDFEVFKIIRHKIYIRNLKSLSLYSKSLLETSRHSSIFVVSSAFDVYLQLLDDEISIMGQYLGTLGVSSTQPGWPKYQSPYHQADRCQRTGLATGVSADFSSDFFCMVSPKNWVIDHGSLDLCFGVVPPNKPITIICDVRLRSLERQHPSSRMSWFSRRAMAQSSSGL